MSKLEQTEQINEAPNTKPSVKRPYHQPAVRCEHVFETNALRCGKRDSHWECHRRRFFIKHS